MSIKRSVVFSFASQVPAVLFSFLAGVCITRVLQQEGRGVFTTLQADVAMLALLLSFGMPSVLVFFLAKGDQPKGKVVGMVASLFVVLVAVVAATLLGAALGFLRIDGLLPPSSSGFHGFFVGATLLMTLLQSFLGATFLGLREFRVGNRMYVASALAIYWPMGDSIGLIAASPAIMWTWCLPPGCWCISDLPVHGYGTMWPSYGCGPCCSVVVV